MKIGQPISYLAVIFCCSSNTSSLHSDSSSSFFFPSSMRGFLFAEKITNIVYKHRLISSFRVHVCTHSHDFVCMCLFLCICARVYVCMSTVYKHSREDAKGERVWTRAPDHGFSVLFHSKYCCQCILKQSSAPSSYIFPCSVPCGLPAERIIVVCKSHFPYLKYLIWIP